MTTIQVKGFTLTEVADANQTLISAVAWRWDGMACAIGTENASTYPAMVEPDKHIEGCFAFVARSALAVVHPEILAGRLGSPITSSCSKDLVKKGFHTVIPFATQPFAFTFSRSLCPTFRQHDRV